MVEEEKLKKKQNEYLTKEEALEIIKMIKDLIVIDKDLERQIAELRELMTKNGHLKTTEQSKPVYVS